MKHATLAVIFGLLLMLDLAFGIPYIVDDDLLEEYNDGLEKSPGYAKRSCIRRGSSCDHNPNDCCFSSACRCNLWGTNCRCHRAGLFQRWGKK